MNAIEMLNAMKSDRINILWLNKDRREACFHDGQIGYPVDYNDAVLVRSDPSIKIIDTTDGETLQAV